MFLAEPAELAGDRVVLAGPEGRHAADVRRLTAGERVDLTDGAGQLAECVVTRAQRGTLELAVRDRRTIPPADPALAVAQAIPKGDRGQLAVELMTEVGVDVVIPWAAERCVVRWSGERGDRALGRWRSTAREAGKQARRGRFAEVTGPAGLPGSDRPGRRRGLRDRARPGRGYRAGCAAAARHRGDPAGRRPGGRHQPGRDRAR